MSPEMTYRLTLALVMGLLFTGLLYWKRPGPVTTFSGKEKHRYTPYFAYWLLPGFLFLIVCFLPLMLPRGGGSSLLGLLFQTFLHLALYNSLLLLLLPLLRRFLQPQTCVVLWLLPNYLYLCMSSENFQLDRPLLILRLPAAAIYIGCWVWAAGFAVVLGWKILSHLRFRRRILKDALAATNPSTARLWEELRQWAGYSSKRLPLLVSPAVSTPLSIGLFPSTIRVVLPQRDYTQRELDLILRHELVHIGRGDSTAKFFLAFCTALCWFNPLMWAAMKQGSEDLELSCDQEVLDGSDEEGRREYARLLLRTAGEQAGFTTCLSASAASLRRRLRRVLHPTRRFICGIAAGLAAFGLVMTFGWATLAYDVTGQEVFFPGDTREHWSISSIGLTDAGNCQATDPEALMDYLAGLELECLAGQYTFPRQERELSIFLSGPDGVRFLSIRDDVAQSFPLGTASYEGGNRYLVAGGVNWTYIESLLNPE
ncbi:M56 family metallopeptidase [Pseudoflavonifractor phocaeensis]|uniref:M56 family metallopeptidase n=1 Tax=Pseudoflavonifractor phocaeensis TaxID=1870988 RepID=UPI00195A4CAF|nr:M56 family metallopeptidase [Pseudoflavonifractor phocaeensis]